MASYADVINSCLRVKEENASRVMSALQDTLTIHDYGWDADADGLVLLDPSGEQGIDAESFNGTLAVAHLIEAGSYIDLSFHNGPAFERWYYDGTTVTRHVGVLTFPTCPNPTFEGS